MSTRTKTRYRWADIGACIITTGATVTLALILADALAR